MSLPLFTTLSALNTVPRSTHFALVRGGKAFPIPLKHLHRFKYLDEWFKAMSEDGEMNDSTSAAEVRRVDLQEDMFTDDAVAIVAGYCRLAAHTASTDVPRDVDRFLEHLTEGEREYLRNVLTPGDALTASPAAVSASLRFAFEALKLSEFLQCDDLVMLLSGYVATKLSGRTTEQMRAMLLIPAGTPEEDLFTEDTLHMLRAEDSWSRNES